VSGPESGLTLSGIGKRQFSTMEEGPLADQKQWRDQNVSGFSNAVSTFCALQRKSVAARIASYATRGVGAMVLVNVMRIPCFGRRMTIGRASIVWPGAN